MDMSQFVIPKSDQLNADDLIAGPRTIRITRVAGTGNNDQPVSVYFEGDDNKPYKPCKGMRRVMIAGWGIDASQYVGRSMTLYRDPKVVFGGMEVGGIRISHMSHLDRPLAMALTVTKAKRAPYKVAPLVEMKKTTDGVTGAAPSPAPAVDPATDDGHSKGDGPSAPESTGSGGGAPSAWDRHTATGDYQVGNPFTRETRRFATVEQWCGAICALAHHRDDTERARLWRTNAKMANFIVDKFGDGTETQMVSAAHTFVTAPDPVLGSAG